MERIVEGDLKAKSEVDSEIKESGAVLEIVTEEPETSGAVAIWLGMRMDLPSGRSLAFLMCSDDQNGAGLLVEGVEGPSDDDENMIQCSHCKTRHYVVSLADAIEDGLVDVSEALVSIAPDRVVALRLRDLEEIANTRGSRRKTRKRI